jgi:hypothetical protein
MLPQVTETCLCLAVADTLVVLIERQKRASRVRFKHPIRVVTLEGQPRVIRTLTANVSHKGLFLRMPDPLPLGTKVALSLEAGGRALALAQAEVVWGRLNESALPGRYPGCGVRFTEFMHPRAQELVTYLVDNLDTGKPLVLARSKSRLRQVAPWVALAAGVMLIAGAAVAAMKMLAAEEDSDDSAEVVTAAIAPASEVVASPVVEAVGPAPTPAPVVAAVAPQTAPAPVVAEAPPAPVPAPVVVAVAAQPTPEPTLEAPTTAPEPVAEKASPLPPTLSPKRDRGSVKLPSGASARLSWETSDDELRLSPGGTVTRAFVLANPARAVFDLSGSAPARSLQLAASVPHAKAVRLGKQPSGTRIVVDLDQAPRISSQNGSTLVLGF